MIVLPAIDLINNQCVRLTKGDFNKKIIYNNNPLEVAKQFEKDGSKYLHIIDLDGAKNENSSQTETIINIAKNTNLKIQTGGGIRTKEQIKYLLDNGIDKVIIGSLAIKNTDLVKEWINFFGLEKIVLSFDVKIINNIPIVAISGWQENTISLWDILNNFQLKHILCTDINKDGMLQGVNINLYIKIKNLFPNISLQASGGVSSLQDVKELKKNKIDKVIIGKALYENKFTLQEVLKC